MNTGVLEFTACRAGITDHRPRGLLIDFIPLYAYSYCTICVVDCDKGMASEAVHTFQEKKRRREADNKL